MNRAVTAIRDSVLETCELVQLFHVGKQILRIDVRDVPSFTTAAVDDEIGAVGSVAGIGADLAIGAQYGAAVDIWQVENLSQFAEIVVAFEAGEADTV